MNKKIFKDLLGQKVSQIKYNEIESAVPLLEQYGYFVQTLLGVGAFGAVFKATNEKQETVAIKMIPCLSQNDVFSCVVEASLMRKISSPHVAKIIEFFFDPQSYTAFIVSQFYAGQDLQQFIDNNSKNQIKMKEEQIANIFLQILEGLKAIHSKQIVHSDLKPDNILISTNQVPVIIDMGFSTIIKKEKIDATMKGGNFMYAPLEMEEKKKVSFYTDYYSLGMILYSLCGYNNYQEIYSIKSGNLPNFSNKEYKELLEITLLMTKFLPDQRMDVNTAIKKIQNFLKGMTQDKNFQQKSFKNSNTIQQSSDQISPYYISQDKECSGDTSIFNSNIQIIMHCLDIIEWKGAQKSTTLNNLLELKNSKNNKILKQNLKLIFNSLQPKNITSDNQLPYFYLLIEQSQKENNNQQIDMDLSQIKRGQEYYHYWVNDSSDLQFLFEIISFQGFWCSKCQKTTFKNEEQRLIFNSLDFQENSSLQKAIFNLSQKQFFSERCLTCLSDQQIINGFIKLPQFILINLEEQKMGKIKIDKQLQLRDELRKVDATYDCVGYICKKNFHFSYVRIQNDGSFIHYNDSYVSQSNSHNQTNFPIKSILYSCSKNQDPTIDKNYRNMEFVKIQIEAYQIQYFKIFINEIGSFQKLKEIKEKNLLASKEIKQFKVIKKLRYYIFIFCYF